MSVYKNNDNKKKGEDKIDQWIKDNWRESYRSGSIVQL